MGGGRGCDYTRVRILTRKGNKHMWGENLNRLGIVLNFFAGFLVAPDLLGKERLLSYEERLRGFLIKRHQLLSQDLELTFVVGMHSLTLAMWVELALLAYSGVFWLLLYAALKISSWLVLFAAITFLMLLKPTTLWPLSSFDKRPSARIKTAAVITLFGMLGCIILFFSLIAPALIYIGIGKLTPWIQTKGRLATLLVPVGIGFFILGNFFQLFATYIK